MCALIEDGFGKTETRKRVASVSSCAQRSSNGDAT